LNDFISDKVYGLASLLQSAFRSENPTVLFEESDPEMQNARFPKEYWFAGG